MAAATMTAEQVIDAVGVGDMLKLALLVGAALLFGGRLTRRRPGSAPPDARTAEQVQGKQ